MMAFLSQVGFLSVNIKPMPSRYEMKKKSVSYIMQEKLFSHIEYNLPSGTFITEGHAFLLCLFTYICVCATQKTTCPNQFSPSCVGPRGPTQVTKVESMLLYLLNRLLVPKAFVLDSWLSLL